MNFKNCLRLMVATFAVVAVVLFSTALPISCKMTEEGIEVFEGDIQAPKIVSFSVENSNNIAITYTEKVFLSGVVVSSEDNSYYKEISDVEYNDDENIARINLEIPTVIGVDYTVTGEAADSAGNTLSFSLPFKGYNSCPARILLSEVRSVHATTSGTIKKAEYIEFYVLKGGNTSGLEVISASDGTEKKYSFPALEVKEGEYITVHYRLVEDGSTCINELEDDLTLSTAEGSCDTARDLWINNTDTRISDSDVIILKDGGRNLILDAVLYAKEVTGSWYYKEQKTLSVEAFESGVWLGGSDKTFATNSSGITAIRTLCRQNIQKLIETYKDIEIDFSILIPSSKDDWVVEAKGSPGEANLLTALNN